MKTDVLNWAHVPAGAQSRSRDVGKTDLKLGGRKVAKYSILVL